MCNMNVITVRPLHSSISPCCAATGRRLFNACSSKVWGRPRIGAVLQNREFLSDVGARFTLLAIMYLLFLIDAAKLPPLQVLCLIRALGPYSAVLCPKYTDWQGDKPIMKHTKQRERAYSRLVKNTNRPGQDSLT